LLTKNDTSGSPAFCNINTLHVQRKYTAIEVRENNQSSLDRFFFLFHSHVPLWVWFIRPPWLQILIWRSSSAVSDFRWDGCLERVLRIILTMWRREQPVGGAMAQGSQHVKMQQSASFLSSFFKLGTISCPGYLKY
jgi:hypothetical protein